MPMFDITRAGAPVSFWIPEAVPEQLHAYPWPKPIAAALKASDDARLAIDAACLEHEDAEASVASAIAVDEAALRKSLSEGNGDPGAPTVDVARRAEVVAWAALEVAVEKAKAPMQAAIDAVTAYMAEHAADVAAWEVERFDKAQELIADVHAAIVRLDAARADVGKAYVHSRWFSGEHFQPDTFLLSQWEHQKASNDSIVRDSLEAMSEDREAGVVGAGSLGTFETKRKRRVVV